MLGRIRHKIVRYFLKGDVDVRDIDALRWNCKNFGFQLAIQLQGLIPEDIQNVLPAVAGHRLHAAQRDGQRVLHGRELVTQLIQAVAV